MLIEKDNKLKLSSPWIVWYHKLTAFFEKDPEIKILFNEETGVIKLYVENTDKARALQKLLPETMKFNDVTITIDVIPPNIEEKNVLELFEEAFKGNPVLACTKTITNPIGDDINFVVFDRTVVQYSSDNIFDINGRTSTLYQNIADEVFEEVDNVFYSTDSISLNSYPSPTYPRGMRRFVTDF